MTTTTILRALGSTGSPEQEQRRLWMIADWSFRVPAALALEAAKMPALAARLRAIPEIADAASALAAREVGHQVRRDVQAERERRWSAWRAAADSAADAADAADAREKMRAELRTATLDLLDRLLRVTEQAA